MKKLFGKFTERNKSETRRIDYVKLFWFRLYRYFERTLVLSLPQSCFDMLRVLNYVSNMRVVIDTTDLSLDARPHIVAAILDECPIPIMLIHSIPGHLVLLLLLVFLWYFLLFYLSAPLFSTTYRRCFLNLESFSWIINWHFTLVVLNYIVFLRKILKAPVTDCWLLSELVCVLSLIVIQPLNIFNFCGRFQFDPDLQCRSLETAVTHAEFDFVTTRKENYEFACRLQSNLRNIQSIIKVVKIIIFKSWFIPLLVAHIKLFCGQFVFVLQGQGRVCLQ